VNSAIKARRAEDDFVRPFLGVVDQVLEGLIGLLIIDDQHARIGHEARERDEVGIGEFRLPAEQPVDFGEAGNRGQMREQRIAVRLSIGSELRANLAGRAGLGFDHHRLLHHRLDHGGERTHDDVDRAARRKRVDDGDGAGRIGVLRERRLEGGRCGSGAEDEAASIHAVLQSCAGLEAAPVACEPRC
jgi:hypothetical protein